MILRTGKQRFHRIGAHLVEFALVIPIFFLFIFALVEIGRAMMVSSLVVNAARTGCRVGIVPGKSSSDVTAAVDGMLTGQGISGHSTVVQVNGSNGDPSTAQTNDAISVVVTVPASSTSWLPSLTFVKGNITGQFSMPHE
jgi:Flp pilus assembly protein TadG